MLDHINLGKILFLDIETVPACKEYEEVDEESRSFWERKASFLAKAETDTAEVLYERAGIYAEFGKIICISVGYLVSTEGSERALRLKSFYGDDEKKVLEPFIALLNKYYSDGMHLLCAHNGKEFDFPYLARRILINGFSLPSMLDIAGKKPWEVEHLDTMVLWKFGDFKNYTSLALLAHVFKIPTPKDDMDGSDVARVYWEENGLERIMEYCQKDVLTIAQLLLKFRGEPLIKQENIILPEAKEMDEGGLSKDLSANNN
ncbi:MAG: 3'-5' exonuclease [Rhodobacteraceae bacterium]|nr:MAG: 3'-5' exonuclease [Paracoccaceae bacterium]